MTRPTSNSPSKRARLNPKIPRWLGWPIAIALTHFALFFFLTLASSDPKPGNAGLWLYPGLQHILQALNIEPRGDGESADRALASIFVVLITYSLAFGAALYAFVSFSSRRFKRLRQSQPPGRNHQSP